MSKNFLLFLELFQIVMVFCILPVVLIVDHKLTASACHYLEAWLKCKLLGPLSDQLNQNPYRWDLGTCRNDS